MEDDQVWVLALGRGLARTKSADPEEGLDSSSSRPPSPHVPPWLHPMWILKFSRWLPVVKTVAKSWSLGTTGRTTRKLVARRKRGSVLMIWRFWLNFNEFVLPSVHQSFVLSSRLLKVSFQALTLPNLVCGTLCTGYALPQPNWIKIIYDISWSCLPTWVCGTLCTSYALSQPLW